MKKLSAGAGLATVTAGTADFATGSAEPRGVKSVAEDMMVQWVSPNEQVRIGAEPAPADARPARPSACSPSSGPPGDSRARGVGHRAAGKGARVAMLDGGIWDQHVDIAPNLDAGRSTSFVPGVPFNFDNDASLLLARHPRGRDRRRPPTTATTSASSAWRPRPP